MRSLLIAMMLVFLSACSAPSPDSDKAILYNVTCYLPDGEKRMVVVEYQVGSFSVHLTLASGKLIRMVNVPCMVTRE